MEIKLYECFPKNKIFTGVLRCMCGLAVLCFKTVGGKSKKILITEFTYLGKLSRVHLVEEGMVSRKFQGRC